MPEIVSPDGRYLFAVQGDGNNVVYDRGEPVWDSWGYEAGRRDWPSPAGDDRPEPRPQPPPPPPPPAPRPPDGRQPASPGTILNRPVRVTNELDGDFVPRQYSYWSNAVIRGNEVYVFAGHVSGDVLFFRVTSSGNIARLGPLLPYRGTGEGWYLDEEAWVYLLDGPRLRRVNPFTGEDRVVFSIERTHPGCVLWQAHSSDDGVTHSATVMDAAHPSPNGSYPRRGTVVARGRDQDYVDATGDLDESHITGNGRYLLIEQDNDLLIVDLETNERKYLPDLGGALSHLDCGPDYCVGEDNFAGACVRLDLLTMQRRELFRTWGMGHVSVRNGICLLSDSTHLSLVSLEGGSVVGFLEHGMTPAPASASDEEKYNRQVKANLDPTGQICCFMSNRDRGGDRYDVYVAPIPR